MKEFRVRLFVPGSKKVKIKTGEAVDLKIGRQSEYDYHFVDVYYQGKKLGEIKKSGIDEIIEKGALASVRYSGYKHDVPQITLSLLDKGEYRQKREYKEWVEKIKQERKEHETEPQISTPVSPTFKEPKAQEPAKKRTVYIMMLIGIGILLLALWLIGT
jgi:hypothetical protein